MNKEQVENYITELESMFELSELEEHSRNILKVGIYINKLQQENQKYKEVIDKAIKFIDNYMYENYCYVGSEDRLKDILKEVE